MSRLVVFCGGMGSGKSTCAEILGNHLSGKKIRVKYLNAYKDLYEPFARKQGLEIPTDVTREKSSDLVQQLYKRFGKEIGSELVIDLMRNSHDEDIYILDSKRNPAGITFLKKELHEQCVVIGVYANEQIRANRLMRRQRPDDEFRNRDVITNAMLKEETLYALSESLKLADHTIANIYDSIQELEEAMAPIIVLLCDQEYDLVRYVRALWAKLMAVYFPTESVDSKNNMNTLLKLAVQKVELARFYDKYCINILSNVDISTLEQSNNEFEVKFRCTNKNKDILCSYLERIGISKLPDHVLEDDIVIDTEDGKLKRLGVLVRFRNSNQEPCPLLTLKFKQSGDRTTKHDIELQKNLTRANMFFSELVNDFFQALNLEKIDLESVSTLQNGDAIQNFFSNTVYNRVRMRIQKRRSSISLSNHIQVCIDELPHDIGTFIELESDSKLQLEKFIDKVGLGYDVAITDDYGKLVISFNEQHGRTPSRVAIF